MLKDRSRPVLPGERLATLEEFEGGEGTYSDGDSVRALTPGRSVFDMDNRAVSVKPSRSVKTIPRVGQNVVGQVEAVQSNVINVRIHYIDGVLNDRGFTGMVTTRQPGPGRRSRRDMAPCKPGDLLRATVVSDVNAIIHLNMDRVEDGVISTSCSTCGGNVVRERDRVRCVQCGTADHRKLASDFGKT